jgi:hypothetical protein
MDVIVLNVVNNKVRGKSTTQKTFAKYFNSCAVMVKDKDGKLSAGEWDFPQLRPCKHLPIKLL